MRRALLIGFLQCATGSTNTCCPHWLLAVCLRFDKHLLSLSVNLLVSYGEPVVLESPVLPLVWLSASRYLLNRLTFSFPAVSFFRCGGRYSFDRYLFDIWYLIFIIRDSIFVLRSLVFLHSIFIWFDIRYSIFDIQYSIFDSHYSVSSFSLILLCSNHIMVLGVIISLVGSLGYFDIPRFCLSFRWLCNAHFVRLLFWSAMLPFGDCSFLMCLAYACAWVTLAAVRLLVSVFPRVVGDSRLHEFSWDVEWLDWIWERNSDWDGLDWVIFIGFHWISHYLFGNFAELFSLK